MSSPAGLFLAAPFKYRGDAPGDTDLSEKVVEGESDSFCALEEFHPKKDVNFPAAGDFGLLG